ncbi:HDR132Cp [Eremothecium sinecaudum]|uniref:HDR132Cp n=1 Tax=Eremothecium sinecaudum TaxID=45286 RepID=A0A0X8HSY9_9SACH|nr:HDR132Cp [Eremothecium sinecaudum]AMD20874.1 HDR132Cp [Eremothecium sinecaudum]
MSDSEKQEQPQQKERRKIEIKFIQDKTRRHITFSKRKHGIMKKAYELSVLTGTQVLLLVVSETGLVYTFTTPKFQPIVTQPEGKNLIQACLNAPEEEEEEEEDDDDDVKDEDKPDVSVGGVAGPITVQDVSGNPTGVGVGVGSTDHVTAPHGMGVPAGHHHHGGGVPHHHQQLPPQQQQNFNNPAAYLNAEQAAVYQQYFNGVNPQQGQY